MIIRNRPKLSKKLKIELLELRAKALDSYPEEKTVQFKRPWKDKHAYVIKIPSKYTGNREWRAIQAFKRANPTISLFKYLVYSVKYWIKERVWRYENGLSIFK